MITKRIQILIEEEGFRDALYYTPEEFEKLTDKDIEVEAQKRIDDYRTHLEEAKNYVPPEPTEEELIQQKEALIAEQARVEAELLSVEAKIIK